jgi:hypothetical protein
MKNVFFVTLVVLTWGALGALASCATAPVILDRARPASVHLEIDAATDWFNVRVSGIGVDEGASSFSSKKVPAGGWLNTHQDSFDGNLGNSGGKVSLVWDLAATPDVFQQMAITYSKGDRGTLTIKASYVSDEGKLVQQTFSAPAFDGHNHGRAGAFRLPLKIAGEPAPTAAETAEAKAAVASALASAGLDGTWFFQGEGVGAAADTKGWTTAKLVIDAKAGTFQFFERPGQPLVGWKNPVPGPQQTIVEVSDQILAYLGPAADGVAAPGLIVWKLDGGDLKWWWAGTDNSASRAFGDYVVFRKTQPGQ